MNFPDIETLVPHRNSMLLVDSVSDFSEGAGEVRVKLDPNKPYFQNGKFKSIWSVELMAQSVAAIYGLSAAEEKVPKVGYLIAIDQYTLETDKNIQGGEELVIRVRFEHHAEPVGIYSAEVFHQGELYSHSRLKAFLTDRAIS